MPAWVGWSELASKLSVRRPLAANNARTDKNTLSREDAEARRKTQK
jgi:hypothetical protein